MPIRPIAQPVKLKSRVPQPKIEGMKLHTASTLSKGMVTSIDPADLPPEAFTLAKNARMRFDKASKRPGSLIVVPNKPDTRSPLRISKLKLVDNSNAYIIRISRDTVYVATVGGSWTVCAGGPLLGADTDRISDAIVSLPNSPTIPYVFANNGVNEIQKLNPSAATFADLRAGAGVSTKYRYVAGFYNRVMGFALANSNEVQVGWSGDGNITVFDPAVDNTAGLGPLIDSPGDETDFIKGGFGFTSILIILRERSIWHATKLPTPQNPFNFYAAIPGIGCDCPDSIRVTTTGLAWVDTRTATVWNYMPGQLPSPIGRPIEKSLINAISDPTQVFGSYGAKDFEYSVAIPQPGSSVVLVYTYNFRNQSWTYDEQPAITTISDGQFFSTGLTFDQLVGTFDDLTGTFDQLGGSSLLQGRIYGVVGGDIWNENAGSLRDGETIQGDGTGKAFSFNLTSKAFTTEYSDEYFCKIRIDYQATIAGNLTLEYSKDSGNTWTTAKTINYSVLNKPQIFMVKKTVKTRRFMWRLTSTLGAFEVLSYEVDYFPGAESQT